METLPLELHPGQCLRLALFEEVTNAGDLRKAAVAGTLDAAVMKATAIYSATQLHMAAEAALLAETQNSKATHTLHSELLFGLSPSKQIAGAFKTFGVADTDTAVLIATIGTTEETAMMAQVVGKPVPLSQLDRLRNEAAIKKLYKVQPSELRAGSLEQAILTRMALRHVKH